jgi:hypothetical protein
MRFAFPEELLSEIFPVTKKPSETGVPSAAMTAATPAYWANFDCQRGFFKVGKHYTFHRFWARHANRAKGILGGSIGPALLLAAGSAQ